MSVNDGRSRPGAPAFPPKEHVIEKYTHRTQSVVCVCGWRGSSATYGSAPSEWSRHVAEFRTTKR